MNSESIYLYSKLRQYKRGFFLIEGSMPEVLFEHARPFSDTDSFGLLSTVQGVGGYLCHPGSQIGRSPMGSYDLLYVYSGSIGVCVDSKQTIVSEHELFVSDRMTPYKVTNRGQTPARVFLLSHFGALSNEYSALMCKNSRRKVAVRSWEMMENLLESMESYMRYPIQANQILSVNVLTQILTEMYLSSLDSKSHTELGQPKWLIVSLHYMEEHYAKKLSVADIARHCELSSSHFYRKFQEYIGMSPYKYLLQIRLSAAKRMLKNEDVSVKYIAYAVGIPSVSHFISYFRDDTGMTPETYRKQYHQM